MKKVSKIIAVLALASARAAHGKASLWNSYQPKEPTSLKKLMK